MRILIIRHAIAEESYKGGDRARALTEEGKKKIFKVSAVHCGVPKKLLVGFSNFSFAISL